MISGTLVTHHHKWELVAPPFEERGGSIDALDLDTDALGTFAGDVPRPFSPIETARRKALLGAPLSSRPWLLSSEGTMSMYLGIIPLDSEIVVACHQPDEVLIVGRAHSHDIVSLATEISTSASDTDIEMVANRADFPRHHVVVAVPTHRLAPQRAISSRDELARALRRAAQVSDRAQVFTDYRAHLCPSRQLVIRAAATNLAEILATTCPRCDRGGFHANSPVTGAPCGDCGRPTSHPRADRFLCPWCGVEEIRARSVVTVDPTNCDWCNPSLTPHASAGCVPPGPSRHLVVPATPRWSVHDVVAHLAGAVEDCLDKCFIFGVTETPLDELSPAL